MSQTLQLAKFKIPFENIWSGQCPFVQVCHIRANISFLDVLSREQQQTESSSSSSSDERIKFSAVDVRSNDWISRLKAKIWAQNHRGRDSGHHRGELEEGAASAGRRLQAVPKSNKKHLLSLIDVAWAWACTVFLFLISN